MIGRPLRIALRKIHRNNTDIIIDLEGCVHIPEEPDQGPGLEHGRERTRGSLPGGVEGQLYISAPAFSARRIASALKSRGRQRCGSRWKMSVLHHIIRESHLSNARISSQTGMLAGNGIPQHCPSVHAAQAHRGRQSLEYNPCPPQGGDLGKGFLFHAFLFVPLTSDTAVVTATTMLAAAPT